MILGKSPVIEKITPSHAECIIHSRKPLGLFYLLHNGVYIGIDNSTGDAWTEEFTTLRHCKKWLLNESMLAPSLEGVV
jgi:hypothetical protein